MPDNYANLKWYVQMGADEAIDDSPINRFEQLTPEVAIKKPTVKKTMDTGSSSLRPMS